MVREYEARIVAPRILREEMRAHSAGSPLDRRIAALTSIAGRDYPDAMVDLEPWAGVIGLRPGTAELVPNSAQWLDAGRVNLYVPAPQTSVTIGQYARSLVGWNKSWTGKGVQIGMIDTGVRSSHNEFCQFGAEKRVEFRAFPTSGAPAGGPGYDCDKGGHGTGVASLLAGQSLSLAPEAHLSVAALGMSIADLVPSALTTSREAVVGAVRWLVEEQEVQVISVSVSPGAPVNLAFENALDLAVEFGVFVVAAIGNDSPIIDGVEFLRPATSPNILSVGATDPAGKASGNSVYGELDGVFQPDIFAPGEDIVVAAVSGDAKFTRATGSSVATPLVAGAIAGILQRASSEATLTVQELRESINRFVRKPVPPLLLAPWIPENIGRLFLT